MFSWSTDDYRLLGTPEVTISERFFNFQYSGVPPCLLVLFVAPPKGIGAINLHPLVSPLVCQFVRNAKLEELVLRIFLIFWIQLGDDKSRKVTKSVFWKKFPLTPFFGKKGSKQAQKWFFHFFWKTALRIFLIFGLKLRLYKGFILAEALFWKKIPKGVKSAKRGTPGHIFFVFLCELSDSEHE